MDPTPVEPPRLITPRRILTAALLFSGIIYAAHLLVLFAYRFVDFDCPPNWPFSIFNTRAAKPMDLAVAVAVTVAGIAGYRYLERCGFPLPAVALAGLILVLGTNAIQGVPKGFAFPVGGGGYYQQYYHDSYRVTSAGAFLNDFNAIQPTLAVHGRTHPPGAVLLYYALRRLTGDRPAIAGILIAIATSLGSAWAFYRLVTRVLSVEPRFAGYATLLYLCLPAVQIYYCATLDAVVATLLLLTVALWAEPRGRSRLAALLFLWLASFLTFGFVWVLPVMAAIDWQRRRTLWPTAAALAGLIAAYALLGAGTGFDYLAALRMASRLENPDGFRLLREPVSYLFTRLENVTEMIAYFGPYLTLLAWRGRPLLKREYPWAYTLVGVAVGTLAALFLSGAYHTGETARACVFLYPYLLLLTLPVLAAASETDRRAILFLGGAQSILMQVVGNYFW